MPENKVINIAKNTSYYTLALVVQKIISFAFFALVARSLLPEELGKYYFAISFTTLFAIFIDLGMSNVLMREVPKTRGNIPEAEKILGTVVAIKLPLALTAIMVAVFFVNVLGYPELTRYLVYLSCVSMVLDSFSTSFFSVLRGFHNLKFESIASIVFQLIALSAGLTVIRLDLGLAYLMCSMLIASIFNIVYSSALVRFKWRMRIRPIYNSINIKSLLALVVPFALFAVLQRFYAYFDVVLLSKLSSDYFVGLYQIPFKFIVALQFLPMAFIASLYPAFSMYWKSNRGQLSVTFERAINYLIIVSLPVSVGIIVIGDKILEFFKPEYLAAQLSLSIIMAGLPFIFLTFPIGALLNACDCQKVNTRNMAIVLTGSILLNILLIPRYQAVGASLTALLTNILMFGLGFFEVPKIIKVDWKKIGHIFYKSLLSVFLMGAIIYIAKPYASIFLLMPLAAVAYGLAIFGLGAVKPADIKSVAGSFLKRT